MEGREIKWTPELSRLEKRERAFVFSFSKKLWFEYIGSQDLKMIIAFTQ